ncbi:MAG: VOC family protein [Cyanobacteria bacterium P01_E01_bin.42]
MISLIQTINIVGMTVSDLELALEFYTTVLDFQKISEVEVWGTEYEHLQGLFGVRMRIARVKLGSETLELTEYLTPRGRPIPVNAKSNDRIFQHIAIVVSDMEKAYDRLRSHKVRHVSTAPQRLPDWNKNAAGIEAFYFQDPDGHNLEIIYFPEGKGDPQWQENRQDLFLGIDHTAIAVADSDRSFAFYRDTLGLNLAGKSENYGVEQEHLNQVFGARLRISSLKAATGIGIEFLEYLTPRTGLPMPVDSRSNDLWYWQTTLVTEDLGTALQQLQKNGCDLISPSIVELPDNKLGFKMGAIVRDPDGHALRLIQV